MFRRQLFAVGRFGGQTAAGRLTPGIFCLQSASEAIAGTYKDAVIVQVGLVDQGATGVIGARDFRLCRDAAKFRVEIFTPD